MHMHRSTYVNRSENMSDPFSVPEIMYLSSTVIALKDELSCFSSKGLPLMLYRWRQGVTMVVPYQGREREGGGEREGGERGERERERERGGEGRERGERGERERKGGREGGGGREGERESEREICGITIMLPTARFANLLCSWDPQSRPA